MANVFMDIEINDEPVGCIVFKLYDDIVPKLARNFRELATGQNGFGYKGSTFDEIWPACVQAGAITVGGGTTGYKSIYGGSFEADNFSVKHDMPGILTMVTTRPGAMIMGSKFQVFRYASPWHNGHHAAFDPQAENVGTMIAEILNNASMYKALLALRGRKAEIILDVMQKALDARSVPEELRRSAIKAMMRICKTSGVYPPCLELHGVKLEAAPKTSGAFGDVWKGTLQGKAICVKVSRVYQGSNVQSMISSFVGEAIVWRQCTHPNLLPFYGIARLRESGARVCLVSPWMENGNIGDYLNSNPETPRLPLVYDILDGLAHLHRHGIVHGDLKGANILVTPAGSACLADFGLSSIQDADVLRWTSLSTVSPTGGTTRYEAPELFDEDQTSPRPTFETDVYSVACVMYEVFTGLIPFHEFPRDATVMFKVISGIRPSRPSVGVNSELLDEIWAIMQDCWNAEPQARPAIDNVVEKIRNIYPGPFVLMRWMMWIRKWQLQQVNTMIGVGNLGADMRGHTLSGAEMDMLEEFTGHGGDDDSQTDEEI